MSFGDQLGRPFGSVQRGGGIVRPPISYMRVIGTAMPTPLPDFVAPEAGTYRVHIQAPGGGQVAFDSGGSSGAYTSADFVLAVGQTVAFTGGSTITATANGRTISAQAGGYRSTAVASGGDVNVNGSWSGGLSGTNAPVVPGQPWSGQLGGVEGPPARAPGIGAGNVHNDSRAPAGVIIVERIA